MMRMPCVLFYLAEPKVGGWVSFTEHLAAGLRANGYEPRVIKISQRTEKKARPGFGALTYQNMDIADAVAVARSEQSAIVAVQPKVGVSAHVLMDAGAGLVVHDPTELKGPLLGAITKPRKISVIRPAILEAVRAAAPSSDVVFCPHPFDAVLTRAPVRTRFAVTLSRLDWDKHIDIVVGANAILPSEKRIQIHGNENRMYTHHKLDSAAPAWRDNYRGAFPAGGASRLAADADFVVDMSIIAGDGDGTQYTFFEAWAAGAVLIVNRSWIKTGTGACRERETCLAVGDVAGLVNVLDLVNPDRAREIHAPHVARLLTEHEAKACAAAYARAWGWPG
jgi:hypothetical protein